jgi:hypothetical protein
MKFKLLGLLVLLLFLPNSMVSLAAQYNFTPRVRVTEEYTDNVFLSENDTEDDFITRASAGGTLEILGRTSGMRFVSDPAYVWYADGTSDDYWRIPARLDIWSNFSRRTRLEIFNRFLRDEDPESNQNVVSDDGVVLDPGDSTVRRGREWFYTNYATARINHQFGTDDSAYAQFLASLRREEEDEGNDNNRYAPSAGIEYWFGPKWGTNIDAIYTRAVFDNSSDFHDIAGLFQLNRRFTRQFQIFGRYGYAYRDNDDNDLDDYQVHAPSAGLDYELARDSRISFGAGYFYQDFEDSGSEQGGFVNADAFKRWRLADRWNALLSGRAGLDRNDTGTERLGFEWFGEISGEINYDLTRHFYVRVNGIYRYSDFINENREDSRLRFGGRLGWTPTKWMLLGLNYRFNTLSSTNARDFDENRVWLRLTLEPDRPWRW